MALDAAAYLRQLQALLPPGSAWTRADEAVLTALLLALAQEFARVDARAADLARELDPRTTVELLPDWERAVGLPDPCSGPLGTLDERRAAIVARLCGASFPPRQYFTRLAAALGYNITITRLGIFRCSGSRAGDGLGDADSQYTWRVHVPEAVTIFEASCMSPCIEPLRHWGTSLLECAIRRRARAHTQVLFAYGTWPPA